MLRAILFDLDDTLIESEEIYYSATRDVFKRYGIDLSRERFASGWIMGKSGSPAMIQEYHLRVTVPEIRSQRDALLKQYLKDLRMKPGALELLQRNHSRYPLGLVSSESRRGIEMKTEKFDLMRFFKISVSEDDITHHKPHSEPYQKGCELLGLSPKDVLVVEDNPSGLRSAKDAGCIVIVCPGVFTREMDYSPANARVKSLDEVNDELIEKLFARK